MARAAAAEAAAERERQRNIAAATARQVAPVGTRGADFGRHVADVPPPAMGYSSPMNYSSPTHPGIRPTHAATGGPHLQIHPSALASSSPHAGLSYPACPHPTRRCSTPAAAIESRTEQRDFLPAEPPSGQSEQLFSDRPAELFSDRPRELSALARGLSAAGLSNEADARSRLEAAASSLHQTVAAALLPSEAAARESRQREGQAAAAVLALRIAVEQREAALAEAEGAMREFETRRVVERSAMSAEVAVLEQKLDAARMSAWSAEVRRGHATPSSAAHAGGAFTSPPDDNGGAAARARAASHPTASPASQEGSSRRGAPVGVGEGSSAGSPLHARSGFPLAADARAAAAAARGAAAASHGAEARTAQRAGTFPLATLPAPDDASPPVFVPEHTSPPGASSHTSSPSRPSSPTVASPGATHGGTCPAGARCVASPPGSPLFSHSSLRASAPTPLVPAAPHRPPSTPTSLDSPCAHRSPATPRTLISPTASTHSPATGRAGSPPPTRSSQPAGAPRDLSPRSASSLHRSPTGEPRTSPHPPTLSNQLTEERRRGASLSRQLDDAYEDLATARALAAEAAAAGRRGLAAAAGRERAMTQAVLQELRRHGAEASILVAELGHAEGSSAAGVLASPEVGEMVASLELERMQACEFAGQQTAALAHAEDRAWAAERRAAAAVEAAQAREEQVARLVAPEAALRTAAHISQLAWSRAAAEGWSVANREAAWRAIGDGGGRGSWTRGRGHRARESSAAGPDEGYRLSFLDGEAAGRHDEKE